MTIIKDGPLTKARLNKEYDLQGEVTSENYGWLKLKTTFNGSDIVADRRERAVPDDIKKWTCGHYVALGGRGIAVAIEKWRRLEHYFQHDVEDSFGVDEILAA